MCAGPESHTRVSQFYYRGIMITQHKAGHAPRRAPYSDLLSTDSNGVGITVCIGSPPPVKGKWLTGRGKVIRLCGIRTQAA